MKNKTNKSSELYNGFIHMFVPYLCIDVKRNKTTTSNYNNPLHHTTVFVLAAYNSEKNLLQIEKEEL